MNAFSRMIGIAVSLLLVSCSGGKFTSSADAGNVAAATSVSTTQGSIDASGISGSEGAIAACNTAAVGITQARLLSNGISIELGTQTLRYELSVLNCKDGSVQSLKDQPILFDLDATIATGFQPVPYALLDSSNVPISNAMLSVVTGSDLFGKVGSFAHWTTQNLSYSNKLEKLILEIKLENIQVLPRLESDKAIKSFLRIGNSQAVTQPLPILD